MPVSFRESVLYALNHITALTSLVGPRIYWDDASQRSTYPNVCVQQSALEPEHNLSGACGVAVATIDITIQSQGAGSAGNVVGAAQAIYDSLDGFRGTQNTVAWLWCYYSDDDDEGVPPPDGSSNWIYTTTVQYRIKHRRPLPANVTHTNV